LRVEFAQEYRVGSTA